MAWTFDRSLPTSTSSRARVDITGNRAPEDLCSGLWASTARRSRARPLCPPLAPGTLHRTATTVEPLPATVEPAKRALLRRGAGGSLFRTLRFDRPPVSGASSAVFLLRWILGTTAEPLPATGELAKRALLRSGVGTSGPRSPVPGLPVRRFGIVPLGRPLAAGAPSRGCTRSLSFRESSGAEELLCGWCERGEGLTVVGRGTGGLHGGTAGAFGGPAWSKGLVS